MLGQLLTRYRDLWIVGILVILPIVFLSSNQKHPRDHNPFDRVVVWLSSPVQSLVVRTLEATETIWIGYVYLVGVAQENQRLQLENEELLQALGEREEQMHENQRLRLLLGVRERLGEVKTIPASVISVSPSTLFRSVRLDRGADDGVRLGAAVIHADGVVGRVAAVTSGTSDVLLLVDRNSSIDVLVQRTRVRARVKGQGGDDEFMLATQYLERTADVRPGDILVSSGLGTTFPKGLRVGTVLSLGKPAFGTYQEASVRPGVDYARLEEVLIAVTPETIAFDGGVMP